MVKDYKEIKDVVMQYVNGCATDNVERQRLMSTSRIPPLQAST